MAYGHQKSIAPEDPRLTAAEIAALRDKRQESRHSADGFVRLVLDHDATIAVDGRLIDLSRAGFRALHDCDGLIPGKVVRFQYSRHTREGSTESKSGWARVIWTRTQGSQMESGFYIVLSD